MLPGPGCFFRLIICLVLAGSLQTTHPLWPPRCSQCMKATLLRAFACLIHPLCWDDPVLHVYLVPSLSASGFLLSCHLLSYALLSLLPLFLHGIICIQYLIFICLFIQCLSSTKTWASQKDGICRLCSHLCPSRPYKDTIIMDFQWASVELISKINKWVKSDLNIHHKV